MRVPESGRNRRRYVIDGLCYLAGSMLYALSVNMFTAPNQIAPGGLTGTATLLNYLFGLPIGTTILVMNIPLMIATWKRLGVSFAVRTIIATSLVSVLIDVTAPWAPVFRGNTILTVIYGGIIAGAGLGLIYMRGGTTGGSELIARLLERRLPHIPAGRIILAVDAVVVAAAAVVYRNIENALYALIMIYVSAYLMDILIYGQNKGKLLLIFTRDERGVADDILSRMKRGVTLLDAHGAYTSEERQVLLCAVRPAEVYELRMLVNERDPNAFIVITTAEEIVGEGFRPGQGAGR